MSNGVEILDLPKITDPRGNLTFAQADHLPFKMRRVYWIYDVPGGQQRGGHAFRKQEEFIVALSGSFTVVTHDGSRAQSFHLNRSYYGLYVPNGIWRHMENFSTNAVALALASTSYDPDDYVRDFEDFRRNVA